MRFSLDPLKSSSSIWPALARDTGQFSRSDILPERLGRTMKRAFTPRIDPKKLYRTPELAVALRKSARTIESWRRCQTHPGLKWVRGDDGRVVYRGEDVLRFLSDSSASPRPTRRRRGGR